VSASVSKVTLIACGFAALSYAQAGAQPNKVGIIHIQNAIISTQDGQQAAAELQARFEPRSKELEKKNNEINALREQLQKGSNTLSDEARQKLVREIDNKTRILNRETEDARTEYDQEQQKLLQTLGEKIMAVIYKYAQDHGYSVILDISSPQTPVLYAANSVDITNDIVALYDKNAPAASTAAPATPRPASPPPASIKPATPAARPPAAKKP
jgi:outer membrane protein